MSLTIHPDPQEPAGGFAFLELPGGSLGEGPVSVSVMEVYGGRWLGPSDENDGAVSLGEANWQGERHDFGPYVVHEHDGADWVRIGPEVVNKIEEYTPLRVTVADQVEDISWPDDVPPRAGAAVVGGLQSTAMAVPQDEGAALVGKLPEQDAPPEPEQVSTPEPPTIEDPIEDPQPKNHLLWWLVILVILMAAAAITYWWFYVQDQTVEEDTPASVDTTTEPRPETCTSQSVQGLADFKATQKAIRACGGALSADTVLKIVEDAAALDDKDALLLFGMLYDGAAVDERIETVIGLSFADDAAKAAEYYARAQAAGSEKATAKLGATCAQLANSNETLAKGAFDDFCK